MENLRQQILFYPIRQVEKARDFLAKFNKMELNSKQKGILTETQCLAEFSKLGLTVSIPYGDSARYDFILDYNNKLYRIQCKTSNEIGDGVYIFSCRSTTGNTSTVKRRSYDETQIDFFATIVENECYLIPVQETGSVSKTLRFKPVKTGQVKGITYAQDYALKIQLGKIKAKD